MHNKSQLKDSSNIVIMELMLGFIQGTLDAYSSLLKALIQGEFKDVEFTDQEIQQTEEYIGKLEQITDPQQLLDLKRGEFPSKLAATEEQINDLLRDRDNLSTEEETTLNSMAVLLNFIKTDH